MGGAVVMIVLLAVQCSVMFGALECMTVQQVKHGSPVEGLFPAFICC